MFYNESIRNFLCSCTNPVFEKNLFPEIWAKILSANQIAGFLNQVISPEQINETASFLHFKSWLKIFLLGMVKNGCAQSGLWTLKLTVSEAWPYGINWFFHAGTNSCKLKGDSKFLGRHGRKVGVISLVMGP